MDKFKGLEKQEYKTIVCETRDFNKWLKENNIDCEVVEEKKLLDFCYKQCEF